MVGINGVIHCWTLHSTILSGRVSSLVQHGQCCHGADLMLLGQIPNYSDTSPMESAILG